MKRRPFQGTHIISIVSLLPDGLLAQGISWTQTQPHLGPVPGIPLTMGPVRKPFQIPSGGLKLVHLEMLNFIRLDNILH